MQLYLCHGLVGEWLHFNRWSNAHQWSAYLRIDKFNYILTCHGGECISMDEVCSLLIFGPVTCIASGHIELIAFWLIALFG